MHIHGRLMEEKGSIIICISRDFAPAKAKRSGARREEGYERNLQRIFEANFHRSQPNFFVFLFRV